MNCSFARIAVFTLRNVNPVYDEYKIIVKIIEKIL